METGLGELHANYDFSTMNSISPFGASGVLSFLLVLSIGIEVSNWLSFAVNKMNELCVGATESEIHHQK